MEKPPTAAELRAKAREHRESASRTGDPERRKMRLIVADAYDRLADKLEGIKPRDA